MHVIEQLRELREFGGKPRTTGLDDATIEAINRGIEVVGFYDGLRWLCSDSFDAWQHVVRLDTDAVGCSTGEFVAHLKNRYKVGTAKHYPPVWSWEAFQELGYSGAGCPIAAKVCEQVFSTPVFRVPAGGRWRTRCACWRSWGLLLFPP